mmetsp:Transcript_78667/g.141927  ORF Transcript_78667/g.141927 Transcript_78667/m.141927 type:complete len:239 (+) Transcript_78667:497-1213(+)
MLRCRQTTKLVGPAIPAPTTAPTASLGSIAKWPRTLLKVRALTVFQAVAITPNAKMMSIATPAKNARSTCRAVVRMRASGSASHAQQPKADSAPCWAGARCGKIQSRAHVPKARAVRNTLTAPLASTVRAARIARTTSSRCRKTRDLIGLAPHAPLLVAASARMNGFARWPTTESTRNVLRPRDAAHTPSASRASIAWTAPSAPHITISSPWLSATPGTAGLALLSGWATASAACSAH